ncbi:EAL domain-containing protein, partial [Psychrosphaera sp.]|nr:EAL domain-containing protein [Psychrosphaera sp.]
PLANEIKNALIKDEGKLAEFLKLAKAYERGDWDSEYEAEQALNLTGAKVPEIYASAVNWADEQISVLQNDIEV